MKYWDSSALVPLLLPEAKTAEVRKILEDDIHVVTFWTTEVEIVSAIARRERQEALDPAPISTALGRLRALSSGWSEVLPVDSVRDCARRLLRTHHLSTADSLQLAAALVASDHRPSSLPFVCLDARLRAAAGKEGFPVVPSIL